MILSPEIHILYDLSGLQQKLRQLKWGNLILLYMCGCSVRKQFHRALVIGVAGVEYGPVYFLLPINLKKGSNY